MASNGLNPQGSIRRTRQGIGSTACGPPGPSQQPHQVPVSTGKNRGISAP